MLVGLATFIQGQAAVEGAERLQALEAAAVLAVRSELVGARKQMLRYGRLGQQLTGMTSAELHSLARRPRNAAVYRVCRHRHNAGDNA